MERDITPESPPPPLAPPMPARPPRAHPSGFSVVKVLFHDYQARSPADHWHCFIEKSIPGVDQNMLIPRDIFDQEIVSMDISYTANETLNNLKMKYEYYYHGKIYDDFTITLPPLKAKDTNVWPMVMYLPATTSMRDWTTPHLLHAMTFEFYEDDQLLARIHASLRNRERRELDLHQRYGRAACRPPGDNTDPELLDAFDPDTLGLDGDSNCNMNKQDGHENICFRTYLPDSNTIINALALEASPIIVNDDNAPLPDADSTNSNSNVRKSL